MDVDLARHLAAHDGVTTRDQARALGLSEGAIARRLASGEWVRRATAVYFAIAWPYTAAARVRVAAEWARSGGALAAISAAWWLGLGVATPFPVTVILPRGCSRRAPTGVTLVQRDLQGDRGRHRGLWVVSRPLAVLDAAVALGRAGQPFLDRALQQHVTLDELRTAQARHLGRRGSAAAGRLIARAGDRAASEAETSHDRAAAPCRADRLDGEPAGAARRRGPCRARHRLPRRALRPRGRRMGVPRRP